jgi:hypothetical protein
LTEKGFSPPQAAAVLTQAVRRRGFSQKSLDRCVYLCGNVHMKKRTNIYFEDENRRMMHFLQEKYGLDSDAAVVRFLVRKAAKEEGYVQRETDQHRQDSST